MTKYNIGDIFTNDEEYSARAEFCNQNGLIIVEIEPKNSERQFQIMEVSPLTQAQIDEIAKQDLRQRREVECFGFYNRRFPKDYLTEEKEKELDEWYYKWLDVTDTGIIPEKPEWLK